MSHHDHHHSNTATGIAVIFSLLLFFALTVAGHYVFVMKNEGEAPVEHFVKADEGKVIVNPETEKTHRNRHD